MCSSAIRLTAIANLSFLAAFPAVAQIVPDSSLGSESSIITPDASNSLRELVEGGAVRGNNLFHSFDRFSIPQGSEAYFLPDAEIANIITRVTGGSISEIFGTLGVEGDANLFLLNPNGIVFGEQAVLDLNGSFLGTTAESYLFNNGSYSAVNPDAPPLLTINIPVGLQFGEETGEIINRSRFNPSLESDPIKGLEISPQQTLTLVGGAVTFDGGYATTESGNIELGAVSPNSKVYLISNSQGWQLDYREVTEFADIKLKNFAGIDGGDIGGSTITLTGRNISLGQDLEEVANLGYTVADFFSLEPLPNLEQSVDEIKLVANNTNGSTTSRIQLTASDTLSLIGIGNNNILAHTYGKGNGGAIAFSADNIVLYGASLENWVQEDATGNAGSISFTANNFAVQNGGAGVNTLGQGNGGLIDLQIAQQLAIKFGGFGADTFSAGEGGAIAIQARDINIKFGGFGVNARNEGKGGTISIKAETMSIADGGIGAEAGSSNNLERDFDVNNLQERFGGENAEQGGSTFIEADYLYFENGGVSSTTIGAGKAGQVRIEAGVLEMNDPIDDFSTAITSSTEGSGNGGDVIVVADSIILRGEAEIAATSSDTGRAGNIEIRSSELVRLEDSSSISVDGGNIGRAGNLQLEGDRLIIANDSQISARANKGDGGNITLDLSNLTLESNGAITAEATSEATGGNIDITLQENLLLEDDSQIIARAERGAGGNIDIMAKGIFALPGTIDASSRFGTDGEVRLDDFSLGKTDLTNLPQQPLTSEQKLARGCDSDEESRFVYIGRGALSDNLLSTVRDGFLADLGNGEHDRISYIPKDSTSTVVEARKLTIDNGGNLELVAIANYHPENNLDCQGKPKPLSPVFRDSPVVP